ncbi:hypothetical protein GXW83_28720 [Streptacidiphilus sp. PB12-B1b]|uniref:hypothetical protein n=1 Tax=Streptacidiphilus sp. PB12-B1b TaxID=2705012 RepID=UPI0015FA631A|nr:hypothetical protein [Streptacidiphilus sp. PB12-B1b]QMU79101.1 hypothetical protein GXW83_28720 [Streptacidiphilus sp. PB12-B1b]
MNSWIDLHALWQIVVVGLIAGAGLPALFAVGLRALGMSGGHSSPRPAPAPARAGTATAQQDERIVGGSPLGIALAALCFAVVLGGVAWGIYFIVAGS